VLQANIPSGALCIGIGKCYQATISRLTYNLYGSTRGCLMCIVDCWRKEIHLQTNKERFKVNLLNAGLENCKTKKK
jgi:hypothetical protein